MRGAACSIVVMCGLSGCAQLLPAARCSSDGDCNDGRQCVDGACAITVANGASSGGTVSGGTSTPGTSTNTTSRPGSGSGGTSNTTASGGVSSSRSGSASVGASSMPGASSSTGGTNTSSSGGTSAATSLGATSSATSTAGVSSAASASSGGGTTSTSSPSCSLNTDCPQPAGTTPGCVDISCPSGSCVYQNATARPCGPAECTGGVLYGPRQCDAAGVCPAQGAAQDCGSYACLDAMSCRASCSMDRDCAAGNLCVTPVCTPALALGDICTDARACDSGVCSCGSADCSVLRCTTAPCGCNFAGTDGLCDAGFLNAGLDPEDLCPGSQACGGNGQCGLPLGIACTADAQCNSGQCECTDLQCANRVCAAQSCLCKRALADGSGCTTANIFNGYKDWGDCDFQDDGCVNGNCNHNVGFCTCSGGAVSLDNCNMYFASCEDPLPGMCTCTLL